MRIIFLDIDGVLNSQLYDLERGKNDGNIDITRLMLLKQLIDKTEAKVVLTSSWRTHWDPEGRDTDEIGKEIEETFSKCGIKLYSKTPQKADDRALEIQSWINEHPETECFVIFDDIKFGWRKLESNVIKTDFRIGRGLEYNHIEKAAGILLTAK